MLRRRVTLIAMNRNEPETGNNPRSTLLAKISRDQEKCYFMGTVHNVWDVSMTFISVCASVAATVLVSQSQAGTNSKLVAASIAAVPAACTALQRIVDFRRRSFWYFNHSANLKALAIMLEYAEKPDLEQYARKRAEIEVEGEGRWEQIGDVPRLLERSRKKPLGID
jgi:hypothetical protein